MDLTTLNPMQRQAAETLEGPVLILAGAGSGKTRTITYRIANLISHGVASWRILALTFTNTAAKEMRERVEKLVGADAGEMWIGTFHSVCVRILRRDIEKLGYQRSFTIYDEDDQNRVIKDAIKALHLDESKLQLREVRGKISDAKNRMLSADEWFQESPRDYHAQQIHDIFNFYEERLRAANALDFDDILYIPVKLLQQEPEVREYYQRKFQYVLVDEYQDTNHVQYLLTSLLSGHWGNICVVGDDDQSIYRFRGATIENILSFEEQYPGARVIRLEQNYRSTQSILDAANAVIAHNLGRKGKHLWTARQGGAPILVYEASDESSEGNFVAGQILAGSKGRNFKDYAILYRTNAQSNALEYAFKRNGVPYKVIGGTRFFDRAEVKDMLSYLCVINNRTDDLRLARIVNNPPRGLGAKTIETVQRLAEAENKSLYDVLSDPYSYAPLEKSAQKLLQFSALIEGLAKLLEDGMSLPEFYDELLVRTGYADMLSSKPTEENKTRLENVRELKSSIHAYMANTAEPSLAGFLEEIALYTDLEQYSEGDNTVVMMTVHSAKGLEFPHVFLVGFEDGLFPGMRAIGDQEEMEEERRLCYVAITRAKETLTISHARQRMIYGRTSSALPSRFLQEIPESCMEKRGGYRAEPQRSMTYEKRSVSSNGYLSGALRANSAPSVPLPDYNKGDMVMHAAFGRGLILSVVKMGGDALLEVAFDDIGTKKLMAKAAGAHMKKL